MKKLAVLSVSLVVFLSVIAAAHDVFPPAWRSLDGTTYQEWQFGSNANPVAPDVINNIYGAASAAITVGAFGEGWMDAPGLGTQTGMWDLGSSGSIVLDIDNRPIAYPYKEIWLQVTYYKAISDVPAIDVVGGQFVSSQTALVEKDGTLGGWYVDQSIWRIEPNPSHEQIVLTSDASSGAVIDQIVVDTYCVPEPATMALLMLGGFAVFKNRRQR